MKQMTAPQFCSCDNMSTTVFHLHFNVWKVSWTQNTKFYALEFPTPHPITAGLQSTLLHIHK